MINSPSTEKCNMPEYRYPNSVQTTKVNRTTNLHNPSGVSLSPSMLKDMAELAKKKGVYLVVDEVYLGHEEDIYEIVEEIKPDAFIMSDGIDNANQYVETEQSEMYEPQKRNFNMSVVNNDMKSEFIMASRSTLQRGGG